MRYGYQELEKLLHSKNIKKILLISFEDPEIIREIKSKFNGELVILTKSDFVGAGLREIMRKTRKEQYDLVIISNINSQVNRTKTSLKLLAAISRAKNYFILYNENESSNGRKLSLISGILPYLVISFFYAQFVLLKTFFYFNLFYPVLFKKRTSLKNENKLILYLRTDLAGKLIAGGSVTHIKGFISGAKKLGFDTIYVADFPLVNHPVSIVIHPNHLLDFFDEIQLMDYHFKMIKKLRKCLRKFPIGVIYQRHSIFNASGIILSSILRIPVILEVNNSEVWAKKNWSRLLFENLATRIERFAFENADLIGVVSDVTKEQILKLGTKEEKIVINPNGVDPEIFNPDITGEEIRKKYALGNEFVVGFIGTFTRWHGVETLFDAAVKILKENYEIKFLLIGDGNLKTQLQLRTDESGLKDKIIFTGLIPHEYAPKYLAACDILVSPHLGFEKGERFFGSPTKLFEYMSMGKPIIASDLEQIGKIIKHRINGLKFKPGDVDELKNLILYLITNENLRIKLGQKAREDVLKNYTWEHNAKRVLEKFYNINRSS